MSFLLGNNFVISGLIKAGGASLARQITIAGWPSLQENKLNLKLEIGEIP